MFIFICRRVGRDAAAMPLAGYREYNTSKKDIKGQCQ
jgi:hypothetical protein